MLYLSGIQFPGSLPVTVPVVVRDVREASGGPLFQRRRHGRTGWKGWGRRPPKPRDRHRRHRSFRPRRRRGAAGRNRRGHEGWALPFLSWEGAPGRAQDGPPARHDPNPRGMAPGPGWADHLPDLPHGLHCPSCAGTGHSGLSTRGRRLSSGASDPQCPPGLAERRGLLPGMSRQEEKGPPGIRWCGGSPGPPWSRWALLLPGTLPRSGGASADLRRGASSGGWRGRGRPRGDR